MKRYLCIFLLLAACSGLENSEREKVRKLNAVQEPIYRLSSEKLVIESGGKKELRERYPWEKQSVGNYPQLTKEFFRCKGNYGNLTLGTGSMARRDCGGIDQHSLPIVNGDEYVYPALLDLLNFVQGELKAKVIVTCGHRCPAHNRYVDPSKRNSMSKHMMGAEVDFYVEGYQRKPFEVVKALMQYYNQHEDFKDIIPFTRFAKSNNAVSKLKNPAWMNREIAIRIYEPGEGRDLDNSHDYTYVNVELKWSRDTKRRLGFNYLIAHQSLLRK